MATIRDIMTKKVISVSPETPLITAAKILISHGFNGLPVVDGDNILMGVITEYDLISKSSAIHLPTFQIVLEQLPILRKDRSKFQNEIEKVSSLKVKDVMNPEPLFFWEDASLEETMNMFASHHRVNPIPVVDSEKHVVGIVSRFDIVKLFLPPSARKTKKRNFKKATS